MATKKRKTKKKGFNPLGIGIGVIATAGALAGGGYAAYHFSYKAGVDSVSTNVTDNSHEKFIPYSSFMPEKPKNVDGHDYTTHASPKSIPYPIQLTPELIRWVPTASPINYVPTKQGTIDNFYHYDPVVAQTKAGTLLPPKPHLLSPPDGTN